MLDHLFLLCFPFRTCIVHTYVRMYIYYGSGNMCHVMDMCFMPADVQPCMWQSLAWFCANELTLFFILLGLSFFFFSYVSDFLPLANHCKFINLRIKPLMSCACYSLSNSISILPFCYRIPEFLKVHLSKILIKWLSVVTPNFRCGKLTADMLVR